MKLFSKVSVNDCIRLKMDSASRESICSQDALVGCFFLHGIHSLT